MCQVNKDFLMQRLNEQHKYIMELLKRSDMTLERKEEVLESALGVKRNLQLELSKYEQARTIK